MTDEQIMRTAKYIFEDYPYLQLGDLRLWLRFISREKYGALYGAPSSSNFLSWMKEYWKERCEERNEYIYNIEKERERTEREELESDECVPMPEGFMERVAKKLIVNINEKEDGVQ